MITHERLIHMLADCNYLPGAWDKKFIHDLERKLSASNFTLSEKQIAQLHRIAWSKRKQLARANFYPPETWKGETEEKRASTKDKIKLELWKRQVAEANRPMPKQGYCILCGGLLGSEFDGMCETCRKAEYK